MSFFESNYYFFFHTNQKLNFKGGTGDNVFLRGGICCRSRESSIVLFFFHELKVFLVKFYHQLNPC